MGESSVFDTGRHYIETFTGKHFYLDSPEFDIEDIAHATAMQCRYTGHSREFYSVAEHNVLVSRLCEYLGMGDPFDGLMHDAQEAYLSDISAPWKGLLPDYKVIEGQLEAKLRQWVGLRGDKPGPDIKKADWYALYIEAYHLMPSRGVGFQDPLKVRDLAIKLAPVWRPHCWTPAVAKAAFTERYALLKP